MFVRYSFCIYTFSFNAFGHTHWLLSLSIIRNPERFPQFFLPWQFIVGAIAAPKFYS